ncbi:hypothetical protein GCM10020331_056130 [Ectobacillus funiculus]
MYRFVDDEESEIASLYFLNVLNKNVKVSRDKRYLNFFKKINVKKVQLTVKLYIIGEC